MIKKISQFFANFQGTEPTNEVWALSIQRNDFWWEEVKFIKNIRPSPRVYHSTSIFKIKKHPTSLFLFGGRDKNNKILNDLWYMSKTKNGDFKWNEIKIEDKANEGQKSRSGKIFHDIPNFEYFI